MNLTFALKQSCTRTQTPIAPVTLSLNLTLTIAFRKGTHGKTFVVCLEALDFAGNGSSCNTKP